MAHPVPPSNPLLQIQFENGGQEIEVDGRTTKKLITNLKPQTSYRFLLTNRGNSMGGLQQKVEVSTAANMLGKKPEVSFHHDIDGSVMVNLPDVKSSDPRAEYVRGEWRSMIRAQAC